MKSLAERQRERAARREAELRGEITYGPDAVNKRMNAKLTAETGSTGDDEREDDEGAGSEGGQGNGAGAGGLDGAGAGGLDGADAATPAPKPTKPAKNAPAPAPGEPAQAPAGTQNTEGAAAAAASQWKANA